MDDYNFQSTKEINCGLCEEFAMNIISILGGYADNLTELCNQNFPEMGDKFPYHVWIRFNELHYDSECPCGVKDHYDLPIFKRFLRKK